MTELKTKLTTQSPRDFLRTIKPEDKQQDGFSLLEIFQKVTKEEPRMWGASIIGFGSYHYKSERSKQEGDWPLVAFSPRKTSLSLYVLNDSPTIQELLKKLGKYTTGVGCLCIKKLADVDTNVLTDVIRQSFQFMKKKYQQK